MAAMSSFGAMSTFRHADDPAISRTVFQSRCNGVFSNHKPPHQRTSPLSRPRLTFWFSTVFVGKGFSAKVSG